MNDVACSDSKDLPVINDTFRKLVSNYLKKAADKFILPKLNNLRAAEVDIKSGPQDLVTVADKNTENWLTPRLLELQPGFCVGEEAVAETPSLLANAANGFVWSIDPIDGTNNYVKGASDFCSMVSLMWNGVPLQCWIWLPVSQTLYYAAAGAGAYKYRGGSCSSLLIGARPTNPGVMSGSGNAKGLEEPKKSTILRRMRTISGRRYVGSAGVLATRIADGEDDFLIHGRTTPWDHAPVDLLCREAGGHVAMVLDAEPFNARYEGPIMAVSSREGWRRLHNYVWRD